jgi:hypothetical protein
MDDPVLAAQQLARHYRQQAVGLDCSEDAVADLIVRDLRRKHKLPLADALKLTAAVLKRGEEWAEPEVMYSENAPYAFKWQMNNSTGEPHCWRVPLEGSGKPDHEQMAEQQGWKQKDGLVRGQAIYTPPWSDAAEIKILYYPQTTSFVPEPIIDWFKRLFPGALVHTMEYSPAAMWK